MTINKDDTLIKDVTINKDDTLQVDRDRTGCGCAAGKRHYEEMTVTPVAIDAKQCLLAGSNTNNSIEIEEITVNDFEDDTTFPSDGFDVKFN